MLKQLKYIWLFFLQICILSPAYSLSSFLPADEVSTRLKLDSVLVEDSLQRLLQVKSDLHNANLYLNNKALDSAIYYAKKITNFDVNMVPAEIISEAYYIAGKSYRILGNNDQALKNYWITIQKLRYVDGYGCRSEVNQELGHMYYKVGLINKAIEKFNDAYRIERERNDIYKQIELLEIIVYLYKEIDDISHAVAYQENLLKIYNRHNWEKAINLMKDLSDNYCKLNSFKSAVNLQVQILEYERRNENLLGQFQALLEQLKIFYEMPDFDQFYNRGIQQFNILYNRQNKKTLTLDIKEIKAQELIYCGHFYKYFGDLNPSENYFQAIQYYDSALQIFTKTNNLPQLATVRLNLAKTYFALEDYRSCIDQIDPAINILSQSQSYNSLVEAYDLLARSYEELDRFKWAYNAKEMYIAYKDTIDNQQLNEINEALRKYTDNTNRLVFQNLEQFLQQELDTLNESLLRLDIENYRRKNELLLTESELKNAIIDNQILKQFQDSQAIELYKQKLAAEVRDNEISLLQAEMKKRELELKNEQQQQAIREQQIEALEQEKKLNETELQKSEAQRIILILSIVISLIVMTFVITGYYNMRKSKRKIAAKNKLIEDKNQKLQELNEEKNRLIKIVAHDLKNPLTSALAMTEMIKNKLSFSPTEQEHSLTLIRRSLRRMHEMINKILDIKAIETDKVNIEFEAVNVPQVLNYLIKMFESKTEKKQIHIETEIEDVFAMVDRNYFIQIIENLFSNALKFSQKGKTIFIYAHDYEDKCRIVIRDEGPGISKKELCNLFEENKSLSAQPTDGEPSTGLGLSIVKKFVDIMGGKVWCESKINSGSTFYLEFDKALIPV